MTVQAKLDRVAYTRMHGTLLPFLHEIASPSPNAVYGATDLLDISVDGNVSIKWCTNDTYYYWISTFLLQIAMVRTFVC